LAVTWLGALILQTAAMPARYQKFFHFCRRNRILGNDMSNTVHRQPLEKSIRVSLWAVPLVVLIALLISQGYKFLPGGGAHAAIQTPPPPGRNL
jgi:hypothetical protein